MVDDLEKRKCKAVTTTTGNPCSKWAIPGGTVCWFHGGKAKQVRNAANRRLAEAAAAKAVATYGLPVDVSPTEALLNEVRWTAGHVVWLREKVQQLEAEALTWGLAKRDDKQATEFPGVDVTETAAINVWVDLYQKERRHLVDVCKVAITVGIEERYVKLAERQGEMLASVIRAILDDLGLSPEQAAKAPEIAARHLRAVA